MNEMNEKISEPMRSRRVAKCRRQARIRRCSILFGIIAVITIVVALICVFLMGGDALKGTWDMDGTTIYQFDGKGEGSMILPSNTYTFKYTINEEEKTVSIDFEDEKATDYTYSYTIDKDSLTLYGNVGKESFEYVLTKTKDKTLS